MVATPNKGGLETKSDLLSPALSSRGGEGEAPA